MREGSQVATLPVADNQRCTLTDLCKEGMEGGCDMASARLLRTAAQDRGDSQALTALVRNQNAAAAFAESGWPSGPHGSRRGMNLGPPNSSSDSSMAGFCPRSRRVQIPADCKDRDYIKFLQG